MYNSTYETIFDMPKIKLIETIQHYITTFFGKDYVEDLFPDLRRNDVDVNLSKLAWAFNHPKELTAEERETILKVLNTLIENLWSLKIEDRDGLSLILGVKGIKINDFNDLITYVPLQKCGLEDAKPIILTHFSGLVYRYRTTLFAELGKFLDKLPQYYPGQAGHVEDLKPGELDRLSEYTINYFTDKENLERLFEKHDKTKLNHDELSPQEFFNLKISKMLVRFTTLKNEYNSLFWITPKQAQYALSSMFAYFNNEEPTDCANLTDSYLLGNDHIQMAHERINGLQLQFMKEGYIRKVFFSESKEIKNDAEETIVTKTPRGFFSPTTEQTDNFESILLNIGLPEVASLIFPPSFEAYKAYKKQLGCCLDALVDCHQREAKKARADAIAAIEASSGEKEQLIMTELAEDNQAIQDIELDPIYPEKTIKLRDKAFESIDDIYWQFTAGMISEKQLQQNLKTVVTYFKLQVCEALNNFDKPGLKEDVEESIQDIKNTLTKVALFLTGVDLFTEGNLQGAEIFLNTLLNHPFALIGNSVVVPSPEKEDGNNLFKQFSPETLKAGLLKAGFNELNIEPVVTQTELEHQAMKTSVAPFSKIVHGLFNEKLTTLRFLTEHVDRLPGNNNIINI